MDHAFIGTLAEQSITRGLSFGSFRCDPEIDWFLSSVACEFHEKRISAVTCWMCGDDVAGYITTSMESIEIGESAQREELGLRGVPIGSSGRHMKRFPCLLIGMLGVCQNFKRRGLASHMVKVAIGRARALSVDVGCRFVTVDSTPTDEAVGFYQSLGFATVSGQRNRSTIWMYFDLGPLPDVR